MKTSSTLNFKYLLRVSFLAIFISLSMLYLLTLILPAGVIHPYKDKMAIYEQQREAIEAITVGNSHSRGIHFSSLGLKGYHFFDSGGDIETACFKARYITKETPKLKYVFLTISPVMLFHSKRYSVDNYHAWLSRAFKNMPICRELFLSNFEASINAIADRIISFEALQKIVENAISSLRPSKEYSYLASTTQINKFNPVIIEDGIIKGYYKKLIKPLYIQKHADRSLSHHMRVIHEVLKKKPEIVKLNMSEIVELAGMLFEQKCKLILVTTPLTREYYESDQIQSLIPQYSFCLKKLSKHPNIEIYDFHDYFYNSMDRGINNFFYDDDHLALPGAQKFSKALGEMMNIL